MPPASICGTGWGWATRTHEQETVGPGQPEAEEDVLHLQLATQHDVELVGLVAGVEEDLVGLG